MKRKQKKKLNNAQWAELKRLKQEAVSAKAGKEGTIPWEGTPLPDKASMEEAQHAVCWSCGSAGGRHTRSCGAS